MNKPFFIMMYSQNGDCAMPISGDDYYHIKFFKTYKEAQECAEIHDYCKVFGYKIFDMNNPER